MGGDGMTLTRRGRIVTTALATLALSLTAIGFDDDPVPGNHWDTTSYERSQIGDEPLSNRD